MRWMRFVSWGLLLALIAHAAATYGTLPEHVPTHLDLAGNPDRYSEKSFTRWFLLPGGALLLLILFELMTARLPSQPGMLNIPDKERFLAMPRRWQAPVIVEAVLLMDVAAAGVVAIFGLVQWRLTRIALGQAGSDSVLPLLAPMFFSIGLLLLVSRVTTAVESAEKAWKAAGAPPE
jgi:hypothetical protein